MSYKKFLFVPFFVRAGTFYGNGRGFQMMAKSRELLKKRQQEQEIKFHFCPFGSIVYCIAAHFVSVILFSIDASFRKEREKRRVK